MNSRFIRLVPSHEGCRLPLTIGFLPLPVDPIRMAMACFLRSTSITLASRQPLRTYKTFTAFDLAAAVMTGGKFIQFPVARKRGVLLIATEGHSEIEMRLAAAWQNHGGGGNAPFIWIERSPRLLDDNAATILTAMIKHAAAKLKRTFDLPVALVLIDALGKAAGYSKAGDENDAALAKIIMRALAEASIATGAFVVGVTHFGKHVDTGTRGSSVFEDDADTVLALLGVFCINSDLHSHSHRCSSVMQTKRSRKTDGMRASRSAR